MRWISSGIDCIRASSWASVYLVFRNIYFLNFFVIIYNSVRLEYRSYLVLLYLCLLLLSVIIGVLANVFSVLFSCVYNSVLIPLLSTIFSHKFFFFTDFVSLSLLATSGHRTLVLSYLSYVLMVQP